MNFLEIFSRDKWIAGRNTESLFGKDVHVLDATSISSLITSAYHIDLMISMLKPLMSIALDLQKQYKENLGPITSKLSKGIASLPDELLPSIFNFAVRMEGHRGTRQAIDLSLVSRRFRNVALGERGLWTTLHSSATKEELETLISRSGPRTNFDACIHIVLDGQAEVRNFIDQCQPTTSRWKTLTLMSPLSWGFHDERLFDKEMEFAMKLLHREDGALFPQLEELNICRKGVNSFQSQFALSWTSPNLRSLRCSNYLPLPSSVFSSVSTFSFSCSHYLLREIRAAQVQNLPAFLASTSISSFELELYDVGLIPGGLIALGQFACPSITSFHLHLPEFQVSKSPYGFRDGFITEFLQALLMPRLEDLTISIDFQNVDIGEIECTQFLNNFLHALLPAYLTDDRARLSSLNYEIKRDTNWRGPSEQFPIIFTIPLNKIPTVTTLTVTTFTQIIFTREGGDDIVGSSEPSRLREIRFSACEDMKIADFHSVLHSLDTDVWDALEWVVVEDCPSLQHEEVLEVVGGEKLQYSI